MSDAGRQRALFEPGPALPPDQQVERIAAEYVAAALGDVRLALSMSVADGLAVGRLVSRGFARWGQPERARRHG